MDKRYLEYILALAETGNMTRAARKLYVSQPTLSQFLAKQEQEIGAPLFQRTGGVYTLTPVGNLYADYARKVLDLTYTLERDIERISATSRIRIGTSASRSMQMLTTILVDFRKTCPKVELAMVNDNLFAMSTAISRGELDMAFGMHRDDWAESVIIMRQPLYLAVPSDHPLAARHSVTFDDFAREPQVMLDKPSSLRTQMDRIFAQRGAVPNVVFEVRECNAALQYVALKFGVSVLPQVPAMDTEKVSIIPISDQDKEFVRTVYLSWSRSRPMSPAAQRVRDYIVEHYSIPE